MADVLWDAETLARVTGGTLQGAVSKPLNGVSIDSRSVADGDIFVAIKGDTMDAHDFAAAALKAGAGLAIVSRVTPEMQAAGPLLVVDDPLKAMERMGRAARARAQGRVIAVTGSVGKTSTKEMLQLALSATGETHSSVASFNNHWGVPLTLARFSPKAAFGVFEVGMNHAGEISQLIDMVKPDVAIITTIAPSHIGHFKSLDDIADAKAEIMEGVVPGGSVVLNRDSAFFDKLAAKAASHGIKRIISFGRHPQADVRAERIVLHPTCCCITATVMGEALVYKLGMPGEHMALNSLAVLAAVKLAGADLARAALALAEAKPAKGRGVQQLLGMPDGKLVLLDESYNANPASVAAAVALLGSLSPAKNGRRIAVLGDMLELGTYGPDMHRDIAKDIEKHGVDMVFAAGPLMQNLFQALPASKRGAWGGTSAEIVDPLLSGLRAGDCVMVKGSLGSRMAVVVDALKKRWPVIEKDA